MAPSYHHALPETLDNTRRLLDDRVMVVARPSAHTFGAIGPYVIVRELGAGATSRIFEAERPELGRRVAVKLLLPRGPAGVARFLREGRAAARVRHPHVVDVFDVGTCEAGPYLVLELIEGGTLAARVPEPLAGDVDTALRWLLPVIAGVAAAHEAGVVHRDLKPANILVAFDARGAVCPKVTDFGISKIVDDPTELTGGDGLLGTPAYMAPEQIRDPRAAGPAADQYSLGVLLHLFVSGLLPYDAPTSFALTQLVIAGQLPSLHERCPTVPRALAALIERALAVEPDDRFSSVRALGAALLPFASATTRAAYTDAFALALDEEPWLVATRTPPSLAVATSAGDTLDDRAPEVPVPSPPAKGSGERLRRVGAIGLGLAAIALALGLIRTRGPWATSSPSAATKPDFFANATPARTTSEPAAQAYRFGLAAMRSSAWEAGVEHFEKAKTLDPELGAAHLRLAMAIGGPEPEARRSLTKAKVLRATLSERDRYFLDALSATFFESPPNYDAYVAILRRGVARFPDDAELTMHLAIALQRAPTWSEAARWAERALALEPDYPDALQTIARASAAAGNVDTALAQLAHCTAVAPLAVGCLRAQANVRVESGRCTDLAPVLRRWAAVDPRAFEPQLLLAGLLAREQKPAEAIEEVQRQRWIRTAPADRPSREAKDRLRLALSLGEARRALVLADDITRMIAEDDDDDARDWLADHRLFALTLLGDERTRAEIARAYLAHEGAWKDLRTRGVSVPLRALGVARRGGAIDASAARAQADRLITLEADAPEIGRRRRLATLALASTRDEANQALEAMSDDATRALPADFVPELARVYRLADQRSHAREVLERGLATCDGLSLPYLASRHALAHLDD